MCLSLVVHGYKYRCLFILLHFHPGDDRSIQSKTFFFRFQFGIRTFLSKTKVDVLAKSVLSDYIQFWDYIPFHAKSMEAVLEKNDVGLNANYTLSLSLMEQ